MKLLVVGLTTALSLAMTAGPCGPPDPNAAPPNKGPGAIVGFPVEFTATWSPTEGTVTIYITYGIGGHESEKHVITGAGGRAVFERDYREGQLFMTVIPKQSMTKGCRIKNLKTGEFTANQEFHNGRTAGCDYLSEHGKTIG